jgi:hypothetical protein
MGRSTSRKGSESMGPGAAMTQARMVSPAMIPPE